MADNQVTSVRPKTADERLRWTFWTNIQNDTVFDWIPIRFWPDRLVKLALERPSNLGRYWLFIFLTGNGVPPHVAARWLLAAYPNFDADAKRHVAWLRDNYKRLNENSNVTYFDMKKLQYLPY